MKSSRLPNVWVMTTEFHPHIIGGLGTVATDLSRSLANGRANITVWGVSANNRVTFNRQNGLFIYRLPKRASHYRKIACSFRSSPMKRLSSMRGFPMPDIIHVHSVEFAKAALYFKRKYHIPVVYTCHSLISMKFITRTAIVRRNLQYRLFRDANMTVVPSQWLRNEIRKRNSRLTSKTMVITHGVTHSTSKTKAPNDKLLFVGRLVKSKGVTELVEAVGLLARKHKKITLTIIGSGSVVYRNRILAIARQQKIKSRIHLLGFIEHDKIRQMYSSYGTVIVPSRDESFCMVALEAMANGVPLVSTRAGGLKEFVNHRNAKIIPAVTSRHIAKAIDHVLSKSIAAKSRALLARSKARNYSWPRSAVRYAKLFNRLRRTSGKGALH